MFLDLSRLRESVGATEAELASYTQYAIYRCLSPPESRFCLTTTGNWRPVGLNRPSGATPVN